MTSNIILVCSFSTIFNIYLLGSVALASTIEQRDTTSSFVALGDWGCSSWSLQLSKLVEEINPDIVLGLGDYIFGNDTSCFFDMIKPLGDKMKVAIGNHDVESYLVLRDLVDHFNLEEAYYSFAHANVHFTVISTEIPFKRGSAQYDYVEKDLARASHDPEIDWIIVYYHKPAYTSASFDVKKAASIRDTYHPIFEKYGVDLVLQAHNHYYDRTYPIIYNPFNSSSPAMADSNPTFERMGYTNTKGIVFLTVGTGGGDIHKYHEKMDYVANYYEGRGCLKIEVTADGKELKGEFYTINKQIVDVFTIIKQQDPQSSPVPIPDPLLVSSPQ